MSEEIMTQEAFNEIIDNLEHIGTLTDYGKKGIKYNIKKLQKELQQEKEKNNELSEIKNGIQVLQINGLDDEQYILIANQNLKNTEYKHLLDDYINKEKLKEILDPYKYVKIPGMREAIEEIEKEIDKKC